MKKIVTFILTLTILLILCGCSEVKSVIESFAEDIWVEKEENVAAFLEHEDKQVTIEETVIYDKDGIRFIASDLQTFYNGSWWEITINLRIENHSESAQTFDLYQAYINRCEVYGALYSMESQELLSNEGVYVPAGEQKSVIVGFDTFGLKDLGIETIADIQLLLCDIPGSFSVGDATVFTSDLLTTSAADAYKDGFIPEGKMIYNENGVKIILVGKGQTRFSNQESIVQAFVRNDRQETIMIDAFVGVNGEELKHPEEIYEPGEKWGYGDYFGWGIAPGAGAYGEFTARVAPGETTRFTNAEAYIQIVSVDYSKESDSYTVIAQTDPLTIYPIEDAVEVP